MTCETKLGTASPTTLGYFCMTFKNKLDFDEFQSACITHAKNIMTFTIKLMRGDGARHELLKDDMSSKPTNTCVVYFIDNLYDTFPTVLLRIPNSDEEPIIKPRHIFFKPSELYKIANDNVMMYNGPTERAIKPTLFQQFKNKFRKKSSPVEYKRTSQTLVKPKQKRFRFSLVRRYREWNSNGN